MPQEANAKTSFEGLYRTHYRRVLGLCRQLLGPAGGADDAAQEVFMRAYRTFARYDGSQPFSAWILAIARNHCVDLLRRRAKERRLFSDEPDDAPDRACGRSGALGGLIAAENADAVKAGVAGLPDKYRVPLVLAYYGEQSYEEIASALGITRNHVGVLILRAKRALRRALDENETEA